MSSQAHPPYIPMDRKPSSSMSVMQNKGNKMSYPNNVHSIKRTSIIAQPLGCESGCVCTSEGVILRPYLDQYLEHVDTPLDELGGVWATWGTLGNSDFPWPPWAGIDNWVTIINCCLI